MAASTVKMDEQTQEALDCLVAKVPLANRHAVHLACLRAGLALLGKSPARVIEFLHGHHVRIDCARKLVRSRRHRKAAPAKERA